MGQLTISLGQHSAAGRKACNQDFHGALIPTGATLALKGIAVAVADGISSSPVAQEAAQAAIKSFLADYYCTCDAWTVRTGASRVIAAINSWLHAQTKRSQHAYDLDRGYVCTFAAVIVKARQAHLFHVGDSRIYRIGADGAEQLSQDHKVVLSAQESYLGRALGMAATVDIDYRVIDLVEGDTLVLSTDGVHAHLSLSEMAGLVIGRQDLEQAAMAVVDAALARGSDDNLTVQLLRIEALPAADADTFLNEAALLVPPPLPGPRGEIDGYRILRSLHASARSHVYLAQPADGGPVVALKIPSTEMRADAATLKRLMMEEWIARRINSTHVLKAAPVPLDRRGLYTVSEYVEGKTLRQWMVDTPHPDLEVVRALIEQIAKGLLAFHRKEMLHQDLRPENIMIDASGTAKIIDFGSTRVAGLAETRMLAADTDILGTVQYTAPEYFLGLGGSPASDLFSLGVIAYELLSRRLPYGAEVSRARSRKAQARLRYVPAGSHDYPVVPWIDAALAKAVHPDPAKRYQALSEFTTDLRRPNPDMDPAGNRSLLERDPLRFWQSLSAILLLIVLILLFAKV